MFTNAVKRLVLTIMSVSLLSTTCFSVANAAMMGTQTAIDTNQRGKYVSEVKDWMTQDAVRDQLVAMGVDPESATDRVDTMTTQELRTLHGKIEQLPAGAGLVEAIGIVFIVLIILELLGVTHLFSGF